MKTTLRVMALYNILKMRSLIKKCYKKIFIIDNIDKIRETKILIFSLELLLNIFNLLHQLYQLYQFQDENIKFKQLNFNINILKKNTKFILKQIGNSKSKFINSLDEDKYPNIFSLFDKLLLKINALKIIYEKYSNQEYNKSYTYNNKYNYLHRCRCRYYYCLDCRSIYKYNELNYEIIDSVDKIRENKRIIILLELLYKIFNILHQTQNENINIEQIIFNINLLKINTKYILHEIGNYKFVNILENDKYPNIFSLLDRLLNLKKIMIDLSNNENIINNRQIKFIIDYYKIILLNMKKTILKYIISLDNEIEYLKNKLGYCER